MLVTALPATKKPQRDCPCGSCNTRSRPRPVSFSRAPVQTSPLLHISAPLHLYRKCYKCVSTRQPLPIGDPANIAGFIRRSACPIIGQVCRIDSMEDIAMGRQTPDEFHLVFEVPLYRRDRQDHSRNAEPDAHGDKRWIGATIR